MVSSLPEFMNFKLFGKTILVGNIQFELFLGHPLSQRVSMEMDSGQVWRNALRSLIPVTFAQQWDAADDRVRRALGIDCFLESQSDNVRANVGHVRDLSS